MDTERQPDRKLVSTLEIVGSHYVDVFYNHIYNSACTALAASDRSRISLTDEYRRRVQAYILGVKQDDQCYREAVTNLHRYFQSTTRYSTLSFSDFVERVVSQFVPPDYYKHMRAPDKDETLGTILCDLVAALGAHVTSPGMLPRVIDSRQVETATPASHQVTIRMLQDHCTTLLLAKRNEIYNQYLRKLGQAKDMVSMDVVEDMKKAIRRLAKEKARTEAYANEMEARVGELEDELKRRQRGWKAKEAKYHKLISMLREVQEQGLDAAALQRQIPARNYIAEADPDPLAFVARQSALETKLPETPVEIMFAGRTGGGPEELHPDRPGACLPAGFFTASGPASAWGQPDNRLTGAGPEELQPASRRKDAGFFAGSGPASAESPADLLADVVLRPGKEAGSAGGPEDEQWG